MGINCSIIVINKCGVKIEKKREKKNTQLVKFVPRYTYIDYIGIITFSKIMQYGCFIQIG